MNFNYFLRLLDEIRLLWQIFVFLLIWIKKKILKKIKLLNLNHFLTIIWRVFTTLACLHILWNFKKIKSFGHFEKFDVISTILRISLILTSFNHFGDSHNFLRYLIPWTSEESFDLLKILTSFDYFDDILIYFWRVWIIEDIWTTRQFCNCLHFDKNRYL